MVDDIETLAEIDETEQGNVSFIHCAKCAISDVKQSRLGRVAGPETML